MDIINHRIYRKYENKACYLKAMIDKGCTKFEIDVAMCKDELVLFHDSTIKYANSTKNISDCDYNELDKFGIDNIDDLIAELLLYKGKDLQKSLDIYLDIKGNNNNTISFLLNKLQLLDNINSKSRNNSINIESLSSLSRNSKLGLSIDNQHGNNSTSFRGSYVSIKTQINIYIQTSNYNFIIDLRTLMTRNKYKLGLILYGYVPYVPPNIDYLVIENTYYDSYRKYCRFTKSINSTSFLTLPIYLYTINSKEEIKDILTKKEKNNQVVGIFTDYPERFISHGK
jgi:glycerophosphoryl diester phosphodiesterase